MLIKGFKKKCSHNNNLEKINKLGYNLNLNRNFSFYIMKCCAEERTLFPI